MSFYLSGQNSTVCNVNTEGEKYAGDRQTVSRRLLCMDVSFLGGRAHSYTRAVLLRC